ncbi:hypothetical protein [Carboxylicivirga sp. RSCT41]
MFWYWLNGYISKEGIDADLGTNKEAGIERVIAYNVKQIFCSGHYFC